MKTFDLSDWALAHRSLVWYFMIAFMAAGLFAYLQLGRQEEAISHALTRSVSSRRMECRTTLLSRGLDPPPLATTQP
jgi:hypothetical protein